ncbi:MAG: type IV pilus assembly protein PilM, partial [Candidatus Tectomicrobia bacterium]|nr:type IV pilus assembly protein PilM [Candidatus Tectomicrobia bacterium]
LLNFGVLPIPPEAIVDGAIIDAETIIEAIKHLVKSEQIKTKDVVTAVSGTSVIVKKINLPPMSEADLQASISWEAEQYIPFNIEDVHLDFQILKSPHEEKGDESKELMEVLLVAAKKEKIEDYVNLITGAGLNPLIVDVDVFAIENSYEINHGLPAEQSLALIDIGASVMNINILKDGVTTFTQDTSIGGQLYTEALQKRFNLSFEQAEALKMGVEVREISPSEILPILTSVTEEIAMKIQQSFEFYRTASAAEREIDKIILSGGCAKLQGIDQYLSDRLSIPVEVADPFERILFDEKQFDPEYLMELAPVAAIGVGLASRSLGDNA